MALMVVVMAFKVLVVAATSWPGSLRTRSFVVPGMEAAAAEVLAAEAKVVAVAQLVWKVVVG